MTGNVSPRERLMTAGTLSFGGVGAWIGWHEIAPILSRRDDPTVFDHIMTAVLGAATGALVFLVTVLLLGAIWIVLTGRDPL